MEIRHSNSECQLHVPKSIALVCLVAFWISFSAGGGRLAAQDVIAILPTGSALQTEMGLSHNLLAADSLLAPGTGLATLIATIIGIALMGYNLLRTGKRGWSWKTICFAGGVIMILGRLAIGLFREVSSPNSIQDWDE